MTAAILLLVLGILAVVYVLNALHPLTHFLVALPSWASAWLVVELAPLLVVFDLVAAGVLIAFGALEHTEGWIGLAGLAVAMAAAVPRILSARRTVLDMESLTQDLDPADSKSPYPRREVFFPFLMLRRRGVRRLRGVEYVRHGKLRVKLDVYMPTAPVERPRPAVIQVHGGGWIIGSRHEQGIPLLNQLAANGWVGFNIDYRLSFPGGRASWPDQIVDVKHAIAWVREHAEEYGVDPSFIAITGGSAGGHLSALAALTANDPAFQPGFEEADTSLAAAVPFYGVYDLLDEDNLHARVVHQIWAWWILRKRRSEAPDVYRAASPIHRVHPEAPPMFVLAAAGDTLVPVEDSRRFVAKLREISRETVIYAEMKGGQHAFDLLPSWRSLPAIEAVERFLTTVYRKRSAPEAEQAQALEAALGGEG